MSQAHKNGRVEAGVYTDLSSLLDIRFGARDLNLFTREPARSMLLGETRSRYRGRGMEFEEVRQYQPGDDIRTIDWRVTARTGKTHTKLFCEERERPVHVILDQRSTMFFGCGVRFKSVLAAELAACIAWAALAGSDRIGGQIIGDTRESDIRARRNKHAVLQFMHEINDFNRDLPGREPIARSLAYMLEECRRLSRPGTAIFIISDFHDMDSDAEKSLGLLGRHMDLTLIRTLDRLEESLTVQGRLGISDGNHASVVDMSNTLLENYRQEQRVRDAMLKRSASRSAATLVEITTDDEPLSFLQRLYRK
jgi:uncharacterized protein (DUF58 family)